MTLSLGESRERKQSKKNRLETLHLKILGFQLGKISKDLIFKRENSYNGRIAVSKTDG